MANIAQGAFRGPLTSTSFNNKKYGYKYPDNLDIKPGSDLHNHIVKEVMIRAQDSHEHISRRYGNWREIDKALTAYVDPAVLQDEDDKGDKTHTIVIPTTYMNMETVMTYMVSTFLVPPIFRYHPRNPEATVGARLLELIVQQQMHYSKASVNLHTQWRDSFAYGFGIAAPVWYEETAVRRATEPEGFFSSITSAFKKTGDVEKEEEFLVFEGNRLLNMSPYSVFPDPNVAIQDIQDGEFFGWIDRDNYVGMLERDSRQGGDLFNVEYLNEVQDARSQFSITHDSGRTKQQMPDPTRQKSIDTVYMYINIIPKDWKIGKSKFPQKWLFGVSSDQLVTKAMPVGLHHNKYPITSCSPDFDGYSGSPISRMEIINGMQKATDFVINSHMQNVRKAVNDMIIVDPMSVNMNDLRDPGAGKLIRTRRRAWGKGVDNVAKQLNISDITRNNVQDAMYFMQMMNNASGALDAISGVMKDKGERRSATEVKGARTGALSRLEKSAKMISAQSMQDIGYLCASQTQQLMSESTYLQIVGRHKNDLVRTFGEEFVNVDPRDINVNFSVEVSDGSMPGGEDADVWTQMYQVLAQNPEVGKNFDMVRIFKHIARQMGAKNVEDFELKPNQAPQVQTQDDETVMKEVDKGNLVPLPQR
jgi:hypothetical protein